MISYKSKMEHMHEFERIKESNCDYLKFKKSWYEYEKRKEEIKKLVKGIIQRLIRLVILI